jgi:prolyl-tRNA synthetase
MAHHGDDNGLVLPPVVAPKQVVIVPIPFRGREKDVAAYAGEIEEKLKEAGIRVLLDDDNRLRPGEKYYKWEMFGVPVRVEVGPREADARSVTLVRRDTKERSKAQLADLVEAVRGLFSEIFENLRTRSRERLESELADAHDLEELKALMKERKIVRVNWCADPHCAFQLKDEVAGEVRGTLWDENEEPDGPCIVCGDPGKYVAYVSRTY